MIRILYVDDEEMLLDVCKIYLESSQEMSMDIATSAKDALNMLSKGGYDAIISDYQMPVMNGIDLLKEIRSRKDRIPFILFTGRGREEVVIEALNNGADFYLQKGGDPTSQFRELEHKVKEAVRRSRAENALKLNEARLNKAQTIGQIGSWEYNWSERSDHIWGSEESFRIFGMGRYTDGRIELKQFRKLIVEWEFASRSLMDLVEKGVNYDIEYHVSPADGSPLRTVRVMADLVTDTEGRPTKVVGVVQDITDRTKAESGLRRLNKELRAIKECNKALFRARTEQELVDDICKIVCDLAGYRMAWIGLAENDERKTVRPVAWSGHVQDYLEKLDVTWSDEPSGKGAIGTAIRTAKTVVIREIYDNPSMRPWRDWLKELGYSSVIVIPLMEDAVPFGTIAIYIDESEGLSTEEVELLEDMANDLAFGILNLRARERQVKAEEALRKSEALYSKLLATIPDIVIMTDMNGNILLVNDAALAKSGYEKEDIVGKGFFTFISPEDVALAMKNAQKMMDGSLGPVEYHLTMKNGQSLLYEANGDVVRNAEGIPTGLVFVGRDMTERRQLELKLREANRKLRVMDSITRHDTLNKLFVINGYLELAKGGHHDQKVDGFVSKMEKNVRSLIEQMNLTREYQNIGMERPDWQSVSKACERGVSQIDMGKVLLLTDLGGLEIMADPLLEKIFYNLIDNSLKHGETVSKIKISTEVADDRCKIIYQDDGIGIYPEYKEQLFAEGYGRNHGMGLFLSREILGITGIDIKETGSPNKGVRFEIIVPPGSFRYN